MSPGILLDDKDQHKALEMDSGSETNGEQAAPSKLYGPQLDVRGSSALKKIQEAFDTYSDKLAVASMFQPADYLHEIFANGPSGPTDGNSGEYLRWTFAQVRHAGELLAVSLAARGVREGMTISVFVYGSVQIYMILYASLLLRCRFSPVNPASTSNENEVRHMLTITKSDVVFAGDEETYKRLESKVPDIMKGLTLKVVVERPAKLPESQPDNKFEYFEDLVAGAIPLADDKQSILEPFEKLESGEMENVVILFTSGTTSLPKPCPLHNRNMCAISTNFANGPTGGPTAVVCNHLPIYHIAGVISAGWNPLTSGAAVVHPAPHFTAKSTLDAMKKEGVTFMVLVPTMIGLILNDSSLPPPGELSIRALSLGASTILYTDVEKCYKYIGAKRVITSYGMTEGLMMTRGHLPREVTKEALEGIQAISPGARLKICLPNSREVVPRGEAGEVHQGGETTIRGYLDTSSSSFYEDEDGVWCVTGDQAIMHPDGGVQITGRYKDLIIRGGVNISPQSIEGVISKILGLESQVVGMPDSIAGEVPVAIVRKSDVGKASTSKLRGPIIKELGPRFALEKFISLDELGIDDFPRTATGKIRKIDLQALVKSYAKKQAAEPESTPEISTDDSGKSTLARLLDIWSEVAGMEVDDLTEETSVHDLADSLMLARYAAIIRQTFGRPFTLNDLNKCGTLGEQAKLVDTRLESDSTNDDLVDEREGPPPADDIIHVGTVEEDLLYTQKRCEAILEPMGFTWDDVQDVITPSQWLQSWVKSRATSDRFRAAYISTKADVATFKTAFEDTLNRNDSLRAVSVPYGDGTDIQAVLRFSDKWVSKVITVREEPVKTVAELERLIPGDHNLINGLIHVIIAHVEETNSAGVCLMTLHTTFDAFSLDIMRKDLNWLLNETEPKQHVPYKLWTDHLFNQRDSAMATESIEYNVRRLKGLAKHRAALWPPQRTNVWQRGCDRGLHITPEGEITSSDDPNQRKCLDGAPEKCIGSAGLRREHAPKDLEALTTSQRIPAPVIIKAALVLLETRLTGQSVALFSQTFAMRDNWPFIPQWMSRRLPSPLEVTGPCLARIPEIIPVDPKKPVLEWLQQLRTEQDVLINHAHAPYRNVFDQLNANSDKDLAAGETDGEVKNHSEPKVEVNGSNHVEEPKANNAVEAPAGSEASASVDVETVKVNGEVDSVVAATVEASPDGEPKVNGDAEPKTNGEVEIQINGVAQKDVPTNGEASLENAVAEDERVQRTEVQVNGTSHDDEVKKEMPNGIATEGIPIASEEKFMPAARDGDVVESIRKRINFQWLPIFKNDKKAESRVRIASSSHFNEVGLAVKAGMLGDHKTLWIKMEWDDGNIRQSEAAAWIDEMNKYVEILGKEENWNKTVEEVVALRTVN